MTKYMDQSSPFCQLHDKQKIIKSKYIMINFNSNHIEYLIEHKINPKVMKK